MSDNPFDEDNERTVIRPVPGGRRPLRAAEPPLQRPVEPARAPAPMPLGEVQPVILGLNPLIAAAGPLLSLLGRLSRTYSQPNPIDLNERTLQQIRAFEQAARTAGIPDDMMIKARYVLCASLDDVAQNTEWGGDGVWAARPLVTRFREGLRGYEGIQSGAGFFRLLKDAKQNPGTEMPLLELMYLCLSLGFLGELRIDPRPMASLDRVRQDLHDVIVNQRRPADLALAPHWQGVAAPYKPPRAAVPAWVMAAAALTVIGGLFIWISTSLSDASDTLFDRFLVAPLSHMPQIVRAQPVRPPPPPPPQAVPVPEPLYVFLKPEIDQGLVSVLGDHAMPVVRIRNRGLFASGSATVAPSYTHLLERIGEALKAERGPVQVIGYTDNQPIHTVRFPSNYELSKDRASAAAAIIVRALGDPARVTIEGRADADPVSSNDTPAGQDENRRIEVVLRRQG